MRIVHSNKDLAPHHGSISSTKGSLIWAENKSESDIASRWVHSSFPTLCCWWIYWIGRQKRLQSKGFDPRISSVEGQCVIPSVIEIIFKCFLALCFVKFAGFTEFIGSDIQSGQTRLKIQLYIHIEQRQISKIKFTSAFAVVQFGWN